MSLARRTSKNVRSAEPGVFAFNKLGFRYQQGPAQSAGPFRYNSVIYVN
jgi:hypothetical protein